MKTAEITYSIPASNMPDVLRIAHEVESEMGMIPLTLVFEDTKIKYNQSDTLLLLNSEITVQQYIDRNKVL